MRKLFSITGCSAIAIALTLVLQWLYLNPHANGWDEADYINQVVRDEYRAKEDGFLGFAKGIFSGDRARPPGYRLLAAPVGQLVELSPTNLRLLSFIAFLLSALLIYHGCRFILDFHSSLFGALLFLLSIGPISTSMHFGMEAILYPAVAGFFFTISRIISVKEIGPLSSWLLAIVVVVGGLSKASFVLIAFPVLCLLVAFVGARLVSVAKPRITLVLGLLALLTLLPWWVFNFKHAAGYAFYASTYVRHEFLWGSEALESLSGPYFSLLFGIMVGMGLCLVRKVKVNLGAVKGQVVALCVVAIVPISLGHIWGQNHNMRLLTPALIPLAIVLAVISSYINLWGNRFLVASIIILIGFQTFFVANHILDKKRDPWDWRLLREMCDENGFLNPRIAHLGNAQPLNPAAIQRQWLDQKQPNYEIWLWRYESGAIDWNVIDQKLEKVDVVITGPSISGSEKDSNSLDNQHNVALIDRMKSKQEFYGPQVIEMGEIPTLLYVYFRKKESNE